MKRLFISMGAKGAKWAELTLVSCHLRRVNASKLDRFRTLLIIVAVAEHRYYFTNDTSWKGSGHLRIASTAMQVLSSFCFPPAIVSNKVTQCVLTFLYHCLARFTFCSMHELSKHHDNKQANIPEWWLHMNFASIYSLSLMFSYRLLSLHSKVVKGYSIASILSSCISLAQSLSFSKWSTFNDDQKIATFTGSNLGNAG